MTDIASIIMAAGRGSRMKAYEGNKTLLPLIPGKTKLDGQHPILLQIIESLPKGPKSVIVNYCREDVISATQKYGVSYHEQPELNGTGGALLAAESFVEDVKTQTIIITMGDVPFVKPQTYEKLIQALENNSMVVLGFVPEDKKQYGMLEIEGDKVTKITEWKYWHEYPAEQQQKLTVCNSGIYAVKIDALRHYLPILASRPQVVVKDRKGVPTEIQEYFITDIVEYMVADGLTVGYALTEDETEAMGIDDPEALEKAQQLFKTVMSGE